MNSKQYPEPVLRTLATAASKGLPCAVIEHDQSGSSSEAAAKALGVDLAAVIKTLVLDTDQGFAVAIIAGDERLDFKAVAKRLACRKVRLASPDQVKEFSGYEVGGVPPIVFGGKCQVLVSGRVLSQEIIIGAAGDEFHGLMLVSSDLKRIGSSGSGLRSREFQLIDSW